MACSIVVIESETLLRNLLCNAIVDHLDFSVVSSVADGKTGWEAIVKHKPDLVLIEPRLVGEDGVQLIRNLLAQVRGTRLVVLTAIRDVAVIRSLLEAGIHGFIEKSQRLDEVMNGLERLAKQGRFYSPVALEALSEIAGRREIATCANISEREREVLVRLARGLTSREIARELSISQFTVKTHRQNIYLKLGVNKVTALTQFAFERGWICRAEGSIVDKDKTHAERG